MRLSALFLAVFVAAIVGISSAAKDPTECEVCRDSLSKVLETLQKGEKDLVKTETALDKWCEAKGRNDKEKKLCYYVTPIKRDVSQPFKNGVPVDTICQRLRKKSAEICSLRWNSSPGSANTAALDVESLKKMRIGQLKTLIAERGLKCDGCLEKGDFIKAIEASLTAKPKAEL